MRRLTSQALPGIMLVIVIFWALLAVIFLTGILASANRIENRVGIINSEVGPISNKLNTVPILTKVQDTANQIRDAAANLSPTIGRIAESASSIDSSLKQVNDSVGPINKSAKAINGSVLEINKAVGTIAPNLVTVLSSARSINGYVHSIDGRLAATLDNVYDIRSRVVLVTGQADDINNSARVISQDTTFIKNIVGTAGFIGTVNGNAYGIETSPILLRSGNAGVLRAMAAASARQDPTAAQAGIPALDLLPEISALGMPALPALPTAQLPSLLGNLLQGLPPVLGGDTNDLLSQVVAAPK
jgi:hydroxyethylthiazole kinase-like sugar kinase family protein